MICEYRRAQRRSFLGAIGPREEIRVNQHLRMMALTQHVR